MGLNSYFDPIAEGSHLGGLAAVVAYKQKAEQALAEAAEMNATIEELTADLESELREIGRAHV